MFPCHQQGQSTLPSSIKWENALPLEPRFPSLCSRSTVIWMRENRLVQIFPRVERGEYLRVGGWGPSWGPFLEKVFPKREKRSQMCLSTKSVSPELPRIKGVSDNISKLGKISLTAETPVRNRLGLPAILTIYRFGDLEQDGFCSQIVPTFFTRQLDPVGFYFSEATHISVSPWSKVIRSMACKSSWSLILPYLSLTLF
jgi:hypothetical protein